jgi:hypothetical protein
MCKLDNSWRATYYPTSIPALLLQVHSPRLRHTTLIIASELPLPLSSPRRNLRRKHAQRLPISQTECATASDPWSLCCVIYPHSSLIYPAVHQHRYSLDTLPFTAIDIRRWRPQTLLNRHVRGVLPRVHPSLTCRARLARLTSRGRSTRGL